MFVFQRPPSWISSIINQPEEKAKVEAPKESSQSFLEPDQQQKREKNTFGLEDDQHGEEATALLRVGARHLAHASLRAQFLAEIFLLGRKRKTQQIMNWRKMSNMKPTSSLATLIENKENIQWRTQKETSEANKAQQKYLQLLPLHSAEAVSIQQGHHGRELLPADAHHHHPSGRAQG